MAKRRRFGRVRRYYARARHRAAKTTIPIAVVAGIIGSPGVAGAIQSAAKGSWFEVPLWAKGMVGITNDNRFDFNLLTRNMTPILIGFGVHKAAGYIGLNRALGAAKIPFLRV